MMLLITIERCYIKDHGVDYDIAETSDVGVDDLHITTYLLMDAKGNLYVGSKYIFSRRELLKNSN